MPPKPKFRLFGGPNGSGKTHVFNKFKEKGIIHSRSKQLEAAIPPSKISALSSGEFVGMVADDPDCKIELKSFHYGILNDHQALKQELDNYKEIPISRRLDNGKRCLLKHYISA
jgi:hypothetical protein